MHKYSVELRTGFAKSKSVIVTALNHAQAKRFAEQSHNLLVLSTERIPD